MSLSDLASLGSFVSGVAVLASLVFLFFQMRQMIEQIQQAERNQRALMNQGIITRTHENLRWLAEPHMADLWCRVHAGDTEFTPIELRQLYLQLRNALLGTQDTYLQHKAGLADQMVLDDSVGILKTLLRQPAYRAIWKTRHFAGSSEWNAYVDRIVEEAQIAGPSDPVRLFKENLAEKEQP